MRELAGGRLDVAAATRPVEQWSGANAVVGDMNRQKEMLGAATRRMVGRRREDSQDDGSVALGASAEPGPRTPPATWLSRGPSASGCCGSPGRPDA